MSAPLVVAVAPESPAALAGLQPGDEIARVDGQVPRDVIEWQMFTDGADIALDVLRNGIELDVEVPKRAGESLGIEVQSAVFDRVRTCDNQVLKLPCQAIFQAAFAAGQIANGRIFPESTAFINNGNFISLACS